MNRRGLRARSAMLAIVGILGAACGSAPPPGVDYTMYVSNGTTMALVISVNGEAMGVAPIKSDVEYAVGQLPRLPWVVEARTFPGRLVITMNVQPGSVIDVVNADGSHSHQAPGVRADLSCGRLDMYVGSTPMMGPAPGPGAPGDCIP